MRIKCGGALLSALIMASITALVIPCVRGVTRGVEISVSPNENWGPRGERLVYIVTIKNIGDTWDNYYLNKTDVLGWMVSENFAWIPLAPNDNASVIFDVIIPDNVPPYSIDIITLTVTSQIDPMINDTATSKAFGPNLVTGWNLVCFTGATGTDTPSSLFPDLSYYTDYYIYYWGRRVDLIICRAQTRSSRIILAIGSGSKRIKRTGRPV